MVKKSKSNDKNILEKKSYEDEDFYDDDGLIVYDNSWNNDYKHLTSLGYTQDQAQAWISKQRIDLLFRDSTSKW